MCVRAEGGDKAPVAAHAGLAVIAGVPRTATVTAESPMVVETLNRREFSSLLDESPKLARKILVGAVKRLYELEDGVVR